MVTRSVASIRREKMKKTAAFLIMLTMSYGGIATPQAHGGQFKGRIDTHEFDLPVRCSLDQLGKAWLITAITDDDQLNPQEDTNGDGIAGQVTATVGGSNNNAGIHIRFGSDEYKFGGRKTVEFREKGFAWKTTIEVFDPKKRQAYLQEGKSLNDLAPERAYDVDIDLSCG